LQQVVGLLVQPPRIDAEHVDLGHVRPDDVGEHHRFGAEAVRVDHAAMLADRGAQTLAHAHRFLLQIQIQQFTHSVADYSQRSLPERTYDFFLRYVQNRPAAVLAISGGPAASPRWSLAGAARIALRSTP